MNSYEILGVSQNTSISEIKEAFRKKAKKCHPDKGGDNNAFILLKETYEKIIKEKREETQSDLTNTVISIFNHHYLLKRFFALFNNEIPGSNYHCKI